MQQASGFTLIELLVVIAIISLLSSVILASIGDARDSARVSKSLNQIRQLETTVTQYSIDTGVYPSTCRTVDTNNPDCTASNDPLLNKLGVSGWDGPYNSIHDRSHGWGGHIGFERRQSVSFFTLVFDDDPPGGVNDNSGAIPPDSIHAIDERLDNDDGLKSGQVQACIAGISTGPRSVIIFIYDTYNSYSHDQDCLDNIPDS